MTDIIADLDDLDAPEFDLDAFDIDFEFEGLFQDSDLPPSSRIKTKTLLRRYPRTPMHQVRYRNASDLARQTPDLQPNEAMHVLVAGAFIFGDYLEALMVEKNYYAEELLIATLSLGQENADSLHNLITGGYCDHISLIVSDYWYAHEVRGGKGGVAYLEKTFGDRLKLAAAGCHTKVTLIRTRCGKHLVMHGSANLRSSQNIEQFVLENSQELYQFHREWMSRILDGYSTHRDRKRGDRLWQDLTEPAPNNA
ncbi:MAG: hypothetical protein M0O99_00855 [Desulfuromonas thiophila]|jgi:hypothetical protein|nr:hypothetical protein [Desulfuromonas thiophila]